MLQMRFIPKSNLDSNQTENMLCTIFLNTEQSPFHNKKHFSLINFYIILRINIKVFTK